MVSEVKLMTSVFAGRHSWRELHYCQKNLQSHISPNDAKRCQPSLCLSTHDQTFSLLCQHLDAFVIYVQQMRIVVDVRHDVLYFQHVINGLLRLTVC